MAEQEKCRLCDRKPMQPVSRLHASVAWTVLAGYSYILWEFIWGSEKIHSSMVSDIIVVITGMVLLGIVAAIWIGIYIRQNVIGASSVRYRDGDVEHDHAFMPVQVVGKFRDHRDQEIRGMILQSPDCGWFRRVHVYNIITDTWNFRRASRGRVRMDDGTTGEMITEPSSVVKMFPGDGSFYTISVRHLIAYAMERDVLQQELKERNEQLGESLWVRDILGHTIFAVIRYIDLTKKRQRSEIAAHAKELLTAGVTCARIPDSRRQGWEHEAEHALMNLEGELRLAVPAGMEPTHA